MSRIGMRMVTVLLLCGLAAPLGASAQGQMITLGSLNDTTGPTSDVGREVALGIREAIQYVNDTGAVNGKPIRLRQYDYGYRIPEALTTYKRFRDFDKAVAVLGWGTGDTEALAPTVAKDQLPYLSSSWSNFLTDPKKTPFNFIYGPDYSNYARAGLQAWFDEVWMKDPRYTADRGRGVRPRLVAFFAFPVPYASAPIRALKDQAAILGFEVGPDQDIPLTALDVKSQVLAAKEFRPHVVWHGNIPMSVSTALRDAHALDLGADHIINSWGCDENLIRIAGPASERAICNIPFVIWGEASPLTPKIMEYAAKVNPGLPAARRSVRTVHAWQQTLMMVEALKRADQAGKLNGPGIREAFYTFKDWTVGLAPPFTITPDDHRPTSVFPIRIIRGGKLEPLTRIDLRAKYPDRWPRWIGN
ncbi:MAG: ABC transporter substrate-binding protein [Armatimonadota bacterium]|nr:ABC transporter substrate-binding protein [Armatimonadota bacterium]MDR7520180.1 ABC transporter substrate-binding protein [Armatimonadota bacterium]